MQTSYQNQQESFGPTVQCHCSGYLLESCTAVAQEAAAAARTSLLPRDSWATKGKRSDILYSRIFLVTICCMHPLVMAPPRTPSSIALNRKIGQPHLLFLSSRNILKKVQSFKLIKEKEIAKLHDYYTSSDEIEW